MIATLSPFHKHFLKYERQKLVQLSFVSIFGWSLLSNQVFDRFHDQHGFSILWIAYGCGTCLRSHTRSLKLAIRSFVQLPWSSFP